MIETIFYFPQSQNEYNSAEVSSRTISFVPPSTQDGAGTIYKNGIPYGKMTQTDIQQMITNIFNENGDYVLPIASTTKLGGIKIGKGFNISNSGVLDVDFSSVRNGIDGLDGLVKTIFDSISNVRASKNDYGIVKIGDGINVSNGVISVSFSSVNDRMSGLEDNLSSLQSSVTANSSAITSLNGRMSSAEASILIKANASDVSSLQNTVNDLDTITTNLSASVNAFGTAMTSLEGRMSSAEAAILLKADGSTVTSLSNDLSELSTTVTTLSSNAGLNASAYTNLENRVSAAETSLSTKASASEVNTIQSSLGTISQKVTTLEADSGTYASSIADLLNRMTQAEAGVTASAKSSETYSKTDVDGIISGVRQEIVAGGGFTTVAQILTADANDPNGPKLVSVDSNMYSTITSDISDLQSGLSTLQTSYAGINAHTTLTSASLTLNAYADGDPSMYDGSKMVMTSTGDIDFYVKDGTTSQSTEYHTCTINNEGVVAPTLTCTLGDVGFLQVKDKQGLLSNNVEYGSISMRSMNQKIHWDQRNDDLQGTDYTTGSTGIYAGETGTIINGFGAKTSRIILTDSNNAVFVPSGNSWYKGVTGSYGGLYFINGICVGTGTQISDITAVSLMDIVPAPQASNL